LGFFGKMEFGNIGFGKMGFFINPYTTGFFVGEGFGEIGFGKMERNAASQPTYTIHICILLIDEITQ